MKPDLSNKMGTKSSIKWAVLEDDVRAVAVREGDETVVLVNSAHPDFPRDSTGQDAAMKQYVARSIAWAAANSDAGLIPGEDVCAVLDAAFPDARADEPPAAK